MSYAPNPFSDQKHPPAPASNNTAVILTVLAVLCGIGLFVCGGVIVGSVLVVRQVERRQATVQDVNDLPFYTQADMTQYYSYRNSGQYAEAKAELAKSLAFYPNEAMLHNELAWLLATCPVDDVRDGPTAVEHATQACNLTNWKMAAYIDTLAASYAQSGDFDSAVKWQQMAINGDYKGGYTETGFQARLERYKNRQTYQEGPLPRATPQGDVGFPMSQGMPPPAVLEAPAIPEAPLPATESNE